MASEFDLVVRGGTLVSSVGRAEADIGISAGTVQAVGDLSGSVARETLDVAGLHVLPGVIDTQVHFREPGLEHKEDIASGSAAAVAGGVTTYFEMPNTDPTTTDAEALQDKLTRAYGRSWANYAFFVGGSAENVEDLDRLEMLEGTPGVKIFIGSSTGTLLVEDDVLLRRVLEHGVRPCPVHAEDEPRLRERKKLLGDEPHVSEHPFVRDAEVARLATERVIKLCDETGRAVHVLHVSTLDELPLLRQAKRDGLPITCEVTPQHLTLTDKEYATLGTRAQMNPPIRGEEHRMALWDAVAEGLFDVIGSDHAPHTLEEKELPYPESPSGMPGVQTLLPVMLDWCSKGALPLETVVKMTSETPAGLYGVDGKGRISPGFDADIAIVDLDASFEVNQSWLKAKCGWSPFEGRILTGRPVHTLVGGTVCVRDGELLGEPSGKMVRFLWKS